MVLANTLSIRHVFAPWLYVKLEAHAWIQRDGSDSGSWPQPLENHEAKGFLSNTDPDPLDNHKATNLS